MSSATGARCVRCNSWLDPGAAFCAACGAPVTDRVIAPPDYVPPPSPHPLTPALALTAIPGTVDATPGLRLCAYLIDLGAVLVAVLLVLVVALVTDVRAVAYYIAPLAAFATWVWLQECQGLTGCTVGKAVMGLRLVTVPQGQLPGIAAVIARSVVFVATLGVAGLVLTRSRFGYRQGWHDRAVGVGVVDVVTGRNPLGPQQVTAILRRPTPGLRSIDAPVAVAPTPPYGS